MCVHPGMDSKEQEEHKCDYFCLPYSLQLDILSSLTLRDRISIAETSKLGRKYGNDPLVWALEVNTDYYSKKSESQCYEKVEKHLEKIFDQKNTAHEVKDGDKDENKNEIIKPKAIGLVKIGNLGREMASRCLELFSVEKFPYNGNDKFIREFKFSGYNLCKKTIETIHNLIQCGSISIAVGGHACPLRLDQFLVRHKQLTTLSITHQRLLWKNTEESSFPSLTEINLCWTLQSCQIIYGLFAKCPNITKASFTIMNYKKEALEAILSSPTKLEWLSVKGSRFKVDREIGDSDQTPQSPAFGKTLKHLSLEGRGIDITSFERISADFSSLESLELTKSNVNVGAFLRRYGRFIKVKKLGLRGNVIDSDTEGLSLVPNLEILDLRQTKSNIGIVENMLKSHLPKLTTVNLGLSEVYPYNRDRLSRFTGINFIGLDEKIDLLIAASKRPRRSDTHTNLQTRKRTKF